MKYQENMRLKKEWFNKNNKLLVETYGDEYNPAAPQHLLETLKGRIIEALQAKYKNKNFRLSDMTHREIIESLHYWDIQEIIIKTISDFIKNAKVRGLEPEAVEAILAQDRWSAEQKAFGRLALDVYEGYSKKLIETGRNDFEDLINKACEELQNGGLCKNCYDHILIDEYQDISKQRYTLIQRLLEQNPGCKLFCVGDDWQSIMSFAGSDLDYFVQFELYSKVKPATTRLQTNYRSKKTIVDASTELIRHNRFKLEKNIRPHEGGTARIRVLVVPDERDVPDEHEYLGYFERAARDCLRRTTALIKDGVPAGEILILSRIREPAFGCIHREFENHKGDFDGLEIAEGSEEEKGREGEEEKEKSEKEKSGKERNKVRLLTVHESKGLEARVVFILNAFEGLSGFPPSIEDPCVLEPVKEKGAHYDRIEEERRLFYVAITRAKEQVIIYTRANSSRFIYEISEYAEREVLEEARPKWEEEEEERDLARQAEELNREMEEKIEEIEMEMEMEEETEDEEIPEDEEV